MTASLFAALHPCPPDAAYADCALTADDDLSILPGDRVRYSWRGVRSFEGTVTAIDEAGRVEVDPADGWGKPCWCAESRLVLILKASAAEVG